MFKSMLDYDYRRALVFVCCMLLAIGCTQTLAEGQNVDPGLEAEQNKTVPDATPKIPTPEELKPLMSKMAKWPALYDCGPTPEVLAIITGKYGEQPMIVGAGLIQIPDGRMFKAPILVYFNAESESFSIVSHFENSFSCIMTSGQGLQPVKPRDNPTKVPNKKENEPNIGPGKLKYSDKLQQKIKLIQNDNLDYLVLR
jgi:hypothetical protein